MNENKQNKINLEDNIDLMDKYNNENMLDNNLEQEKINEDYINNVMKIVENKNIPEDIKPLNVKWAFTIKYNI
jgi:hypothetical protein